MTEQAGFSEIGLALAQIPEVTEPMPVMELGTRVLAPERLLQDVLHASAADASMMPYGNAGALAAHDGKRLRAFVHPITGESSVFPLLESLRPGRNLEDLAGRAGRRLATDASLFPKDGTEVVPQAPITLAGAHHRRDGGHTGPAAEFLAFVRFEREIKGRPVFGPGTRAMAAVGEDGRIRGLSHRWRTAHPIALKQSARPRIDIARAIQAQLEPIAATSNVRVDRVKLGHYDSGGMFLQPVYHFAATISSRRRGRREADRHVTGFVPLGEALEPLPSLGGDTTRMPSEPRRTPHDHRQSPPPGDPTVGRYVVRNSEPGWVASANGFYASLLQANAMGSPIPFTDAQYYWAQPNEFLADKNSFVNSVNIALNEVHGNWGEFSTLSNDADFVFLDNVPPGGYGGGSGGDLAYWILHSCEVIPTATDESGSFDVWWNIFNGLRAVVGYRTEMWINDGVTSPFGLAVGLGMPVISAWFTSIASNSNYGANDATYFDQDRQITEPMGRASAIAVCGHGDDTANDIASIGPADCLTEWWFNN
jgi:hypothetical protein